MFSIPQHFYNTFSPHQFRVATKGSYEIIIHGIMCTLYLHPQLGWFPIRCGKRLQFGVKRGHISKKYVVGGNIIQFIPFVCPFYAFEYPLFCSHHNHESDVIIIPSTMVIHQGDILGKVIFVLTHFKLLLL